MKHSLSATNHFLGFSQKTILLFIFFLLFSNSAFSQGYSSYIKKAALVGENPSIIKEASLGKYLILHKSHFSSFFLISDTSTWLHSLDFSYNNYFLVNDFSILNDWVYFCGESTDENDTFAVVGWFDLTSFPHTTIYYNKIPDLKTLNKIETKRCGLGLKFAYMIGQTRDGVPAFVTANIYNYSSGSPSTIYFSKATDGNVNILDDIEINDKYVVVTGRDTNKHKGYLYFFYHPQLLSGGTYATFSQYCNVGYSIDNPILLKQCEGNYMVTASSNSMRHYVHAFDSTSIKHIIMIDRENGAIERDLAYNWNLQELDLLVGNSQGQNEECFSYIYHLRANDTTSNPFYIHDYTGHNIYSLCKTTDDFFHPNWFIAIGGDCTFHQMCWYRYFIYDWECATRRIKETIEEKIIPDCNEHTFTPECKETETVTINKRIRRYEYYTICPELEEGEEYEEGEEIDSK